MLGEGITQSTMTNVDAFPYGFPMLGKSNRKITLGLLHGMYDKAFKSDFADGFKFGRRYDGFFDTSTG